MAKKPASGCNGTEFLGNPERVTLYLNVLEETGEHVIARREVGVSHATVNAARKKDKDFFEAEAEALRVYRAKLAMEINRRGFKGWDEPVYYLGKEVGYVRKYSDRLAELHIKRHCPEYRDRVQVDQTNVNADLPMKDLSKLSKESRADLRKILQREREKLKQEEEDVE